MSKLTNIGVTTDKPGIYSNLPIEQFNVQNKQTCNIFTRIAQFCALIITSMSFALVIWISLITIVREGQNADDEKIPILVFMFVSIVMVMFIRKSIIKKLIVWARSYRARAILIIIAFILFILGLIARFGFLVFDYAPTSDTMQFFKNATSLSQYNSLNSPTYVAMYPYLFAYNVLLARVFDITGSGLIGIIILNTVFDVISTFMIGYLIHSLTASRKWQLFTSVVWWISPYNIIFCALSLPIIIVNTLILTVLVLFVYLFKNVKHIWRLLILSAAISVALVIQDAFRPITIILIIAILLYYTVYLFNKGNWRVFRNCIFSIMTIVILSGTLGYSWQQVVNSATGLPTNTNKQGWSVYVGSNYESNGGWNRNDSDHMENLVQEYDGDYSKAFAMLQREGIERWSRLGPVKAIELVINKSIRFAGDIQNMIYNLPGSYPYWKHQDQPMHFMHIICAIYWLLMLGFTDYKLFIRRKMKEVDYVGFISMLIIGFLLSFMAVEVANRYFTILFPMFTVLAVLGFKSLLDSSMSQNSAVSS